MTGKVSIDDPTRAQLQQTGELRVEDTHGLPLVLMTIDAREKLARQQPAPQQLDNGVTR